MNLGWFTITNIEHLDYHPLFTEQGYKKLPVIQGSFSQDKGKAVATRPPSMDIHSSWDLEPAVKDESEMLEEKEPSLESPVKCSNTPMPEQWGCDLHKEIAA